MEDVVKCPICGQVMDARACPCCRISPASADGSAGDDAARHRDETAEVRDRAAERRDRGAEHRDARARDDEFAVTDRDKIASDQAQARSDDDGVSSHRDQQAADFDQRTANDEYASGGDAIRYHRALASRERSRRERDSVSESRDETSAARLHEHDGADAVHLLRVGERDRLEAASDREDAAGDRHESARERAAALRDRTESAGAADRALEVLESMSDAFFTLDSEWRFTYLNPQCEMVLERRREDLVGRNVWEEFPNTVGSRFDEEYRRAVREHVAVRFEGDYTARGRTVDVRAHPVAGGLAVYFTDVTDERLRAFRLRQTERLEMLGQLTAGVAHDFNNLLAAVGGFAHLGQAAAVDEKTRGYFDQIDSASTRAAALTRQLLAFGREQDLSPTLIDLNEVVDALFSLLSQLTPPRIELRVALSPRAVPVFVDRSQIEQVLLNLVVNARDAIEENGSITVSTIDGAPAGLEHDVQMPSAWLQVTDSGSGIPEAVRPHIFDPFFSTKPPETGTGLGLATIYGIVAQTGGSIFVDSTVGLGTTMTVALPAGEPA
jgi:PAS domain S-box-containing protein